MSGIPYYRSVVHWDHVDGLYTSGWAEITLLADSFGESRLYTRTEYTCMTTEASSLRPGLPPGSHRNLRGVGAGCGDAVDPDDDHRVVLMKSSLRRESACRPWSTRGQTDGPSVWIDEDADGEVDLVKSAVHDDGRLVEYREERLSGEHPVGQPPPMSLFIAEYDEHLTLTGTRTDWDGDGTWDIVRSRTIVLRGGVPRIRPGGLRPRP